MLRSSIRLAHPACAQNSSAPIRGHETGDIVIGASVNVIGGTPDASNAVSGQIIATYFMAPNIAVN